MNANVSVFSIFINSVIIEIGLDCLYFVIIHTKKNCFYNISLRRRNKDSKVTKHLLYIPILEDYYYVKSYLMLVLFNDDFSDIADYIENNTCQVLKRKNRNAKGSSRFVRLEYNIDILNNIRTCICKYFEERMHLLPMCDSKMKRNIKEISKKFQ